MELGTDKKTFFRQAREDPVLKFFPVVFVIVHIPYFLPDLSFEQHETYVWYLSTFFLLPFTALILWPFHKYQIPNYERNFWKLLSFGFSLWWVVSVINLLWFTKIWEMLWFANAWSASIDVIIDSLYFGFYICWLIALSFAPDNQRNQGFGRQDRRLIGAGIFVLSFFMFFYFFLAPSQYTPEGYATWAPSLLFFSYMDVIVTLLLLRLTFKARSPRWQILYGILAINMFTFMLVDLLEAMVAKGEFEWALSNWSDIIWSIPFLLTVVAARVRCFSFPQPAIEKRAGIQVNDRPFTLVSPIILMSFILPVLHISLEQLQLIENELRPILGAVILGSLVPFWILALLENRSLRRFSRLSEAHAAENERLRVKQKVSEETERAKSQFLANVSHEIRTPMNGILGMSEIILRRTLDDELRDQVDLVRSSAKGLLEVIDDILVHSKIEAGVVSFSQDPFNLANIAEQVIDLFRVNWKKKHIEIHLDFQDDMPLELEGDASRLRQVLVNLVGNAIKFTTEGQVRVRFSLSGEQGSTVCIRCEVQDSGIGINPESLDKLFLPFSQADESTSRTYGGSGLGLAISKKIIEAQSGKIGVFSEPGKGSSFWFEVPYLVAVNTVDKAKHDLDTEVTTSTGGRVLLAEDNEINQIVAVSQLKILGRKVDVASNGKEVLQALGKQDYSLILMDCQMPELDGIETTRLIREQGYSKSDLPIIALTAHVFGEDRDRCIEAGMNDFLSKPLSLEQLSKALETWL